MLHRELRDLWYSAVAAFAQSHDWPVAWPNQHFDDRSVDRYLQVRQFAANAQVFEIGGAARHVFILQLAVVVRDDTGDQVALMMADQLLASFPVLHRLVGAVHQFEVNEPPTPAPPVALAGWQATPISCQVQCISRP